MKMLSLPSYSLQLSISILIWKFVCRSYGLWLEDWRLARTFLLDASRDLASLHMRTLAGALQNRGARYFWDVFDEGTSQTGMKFYEIQNSIAFVLNYLSCLFLETVNICIKYALLLSLYDFIYIESFLFVSWLGLDNIDLLMQHLI